jgi:hypothetical protein
VSSDGVDGAHSARRTVRVAERRVWVREREREQKSAVRAREGGDNCTSIKLVLVDVGHR